MNPPTTRSLPESRFRALNAARIERLRALLDAPARAAFDALPTRLHAASPDGAIAAIYAMGSAGTIGHGPDSDLDVWVITPTTDDPALANEAHNIVAMLLADVTTHDEVLNAVRQAKPAHLEAVDLFDVFRGSHVPSGQKSMAYAFTYRASDRTLTDSEVNTAHEKLVTHLKSALNANVRV